MPTISLLPPSSTSARNATGQPLPQILRTPSGLAMLEIQGTLNTPSHEASAGPAARPIGRLVFPLYTPDAGLDDTAWHKRVHLYVGKHQRLTGEVKKLRNPIAVIRRQVQADASSSTDTTGLEVADIVYYKLLFTQRPEPVGGASEHR